MYNFELSNLELNSISVFSTMSSGLCSIGLYFVYNKYQNLVVSAVFSGVISCGNAALDCLITEVFPTNLRATGIAISMVAARLGGIIGNIVIAQLLDMYCPAPTFIVAALLIGEFLKSQYGLLILKCWNFKLELTSNSKILLRIHEMLSAILLSDNLVLGQHWDESQYFLMREFSYIMSKCWIRLNAKVKNCVEFVLMQEF